jgi:arylsulfatase A-like enzyme
MLGRDANATAPSAAQNTKPNIVMLMTDDTGWNDFGSISLGGATLGHPTPNLDRMAKEGAVFTSWYGQASCTAGRASFMTGRIPIRSALSVVVGPGDRNMLRKETPTIAEFFQKNGYSTFFTGKWHLGDVPESFPINHGFDEMKQFAAYYAGVYAYPDTSKWFHPWFPAYNPEFMKMYDSVVNAGEYEGVAGQPAKKVATITYDSLATYDERMADNTVAYITIVIVTADNGAWMDAYPDAGTTPFRGEKGTPFEGGWRVPAIMWWPNHIPAGAVYGEMMSHIDCWSTLKNLPKGAIPMPN